MRTYQVEGLILPGFFKTALLRTDFDNVRVRDMKYPVALIRTEEGYSVFCPGLPGCWSQGATEEEALANIRDAIQEYLEVAKQLAGEQNLREVEISA